MSSVLVSADAAVYAEVRPVTLLVGRHRYGFTLGHGRGQCRCALPPTVANKEPTPAWMRFLIIAWLFIALALLVWGLVRHNWFATTAGATAVIENAAQLWREDRLRRVS